MKDLVQRLFVTGAAVAAFGLAPQASAQQSSEGINPQVVSGYASCFDEAETVVEVCGFEPLGSFVVDSAQDATWREGDTDVTFVVSKWMAHSERPPKGLEFTDESVLDQFFGGLGAVFVYAETTANLYCYSGSGPTMDSDLVAPQLEDISHYEACSAPGSCRLDPDSLNEICERASSEIIKLENIDNTPISTCGCPNPDPDDPDLEITIEQCSDAVCSNLPGDQILAPGASRVSYGDGLVGSKCRKETTCEVPPLGGDLVCMTKKICKKKKNNE